LARADRPIESQKQGATPRSRPGTAKPPDTAKPPVVELPESARIVCMSSPLDLKQKTKLDTAKSPTFYSPTQ
jgi:hypothetical protein